MKRKFDYHGLIGEGNPLLRYPLLLEAAIEEFSKKKFEDASLNDILKNADMSKGSFYYNMGDKFGLYLAMMDIIVVKKKTFFIPLLAERQDNGEFFDTIKLVVRATIEYMYADERLYHLSNRFMEVNEELKIRIMEYFPYDFSQIFDGLIRAAIQEGQVGDNFTPEFVSKILEVLFSNLHKFISPNRKTEETLVVMEQMVDLIQYGISVNKEDE